MTANWYNDATTNFKTFREDKPMTTRTKPEFIGWANAILRIAGIGRYDNGQPWLEYKMSDDGEIRACDYNECIAVENWQDITEADLQDEAAAYLDATI